MKTNILRNTIVTGLMTFGLSSLAFADNDVAKYEQLTSKAKKTLSQAISAAEAHHSGKAVSAEIDSKLGSAIYEVEVLSKGELFDVDVDAVTGKVLNSRKDND